MRWKWISVAALLVIVGAGASVSLRHERKDGKAATTAGDKKQNKSSKDVAADDLVAIIHDTESAETLVTALYALVALHPDDKTIVPLAIRNADRLGLLKGLYGDDQSPTQQAFSDALDVLLGEDIQRIERRRTGPAGGGVAGRGPACMAPAAVSPLPICPPEFSSGPIPAQFIPPAPLAEPAPKPVPRQPMNPASY